MMSKNFFVTYGYYLVLLLSYFLIGVFFYLNMSKEFLTTFTVIYALSLCFLLELYNPKKVFKINYKKDLIYLAGNLLFLSIGGFLTIKAFSIISQALVGNKTILDIDSIFTIYTQVIICFFLVDFIRYWIHRFQHEIPSLWKLHSVHHSVPELYSINNFYSNPIDLFVRHGIPAYILAVAGFNPLALGSALSLIAIIGIFSHSNIDFKFKRLNKYITTNEVHRWHHSAELASRNKNFSPSLIIWDRIFGTYYLEEERDGPSRLGI